VPTLFASLLSSSDFPGTHPLSPRLCTSAGEALPEHLARTWVARTGVEIVDGIGSTEIGHIFISNLPGDIRPDSSGRVVPGYEARIVDEEGAPVPDGEPGSLLVKGDSTCAFYWNQHQRTKTTFLGEWVNTGDKYVRSPDGYFSYQGRSDDMMKVSGMWLSPIEVEAAINTHEAVLECAVAGVVDQTRLIQPRAYVVLQPGRTGGPELAAELREHVRSRLAHFKCPRDFQFVEVLPKTATGKIQRFKLRAVLASEPAPA